MEARPKPETAPPLAGEDRSDLKTLLRTVPFPVSRAELYRLAVRNGLDRSTVAALATLDEPEYTGSFQVLRELRHHGDLRRSA
ncbi:MAG TPA: DUF2795 domain-containing protein [Plantibacter sp.]|uniref:DUF2795 domain-containing protein n=1 Tax=unclassified Plantibacter TaxID=2624265 RepID=UPI002C798FDE|nr:DUF2795 domain-containing protein [Plantibacter sp.]